MKVGAKVGATYLVQYSWCKVGAKVVSLYGAKVGHLYLFLHLLLLIPLVYIRTADTLKYHIPISQYPH